MGESSTSNRKRATDAEQVVPILHARNLSKTFKMGDGEVPVLNDAALTLRAGEFVAIEGRSGSGKSTLLHILGALDEADEGTIDFNGVLYGGKLPVPAWLAVSRFIGRNWIIGLAYTFICLIVGALALTSRIYEPMPEQYREYRAKALEEDQMKEVERDLQRATMFAGLADLGRISILIMGVPIFGSAAVCLVTGWLRDRRPAYLRNREFGFVFQQYHLLPELNVLENTLISQMAMHGPIGYLRRRGELRTRAKELLKQLGLEHRLKQKPTKLSGGERQRVAIARALMNQPKILFADEPTGNLDATTGRQIMNVLEDLHQNRGQTIVMVTHDRALAREADRVLVLRNGKLEKAE